MPIVKIEESDHSDKESKVAGKIEVDGKEYSAEDVKNILAQGATATQKAQEVAGVKAAAEKYGVDLETYMGQAEGAFGVMSELISAGIIDEKGNVIKKEEKGTPIKEPEGDELAKLFGLPPGDTKVTGAAKIAEIVQRALAPQLGEITKLAERVAAVDKTQGDMIRLNLEKEVGGKYPALKSHDISQVFARAMNDRSKSLWEHAEAVNAVRSAELASTRAIHAKEFGVDLTKFDENKLKEQEAGGGAGVIFKGKKFSFNAKKGDEKAVNPRSAAIEYIERITSGS